MAGLWCCGLPVVLCLVCGMWSSFSCFLSSPPPSLEPRRPKASLLCAPLPSTAALRPSAPHCGQPSKRLPSVGCNGRCARGATTKPLLMVMVGHTRGLSLNALCHHAKNLAALLEHPDNQLTQSSLLLVIQMSDYPLWCLMFEGQPDRHKMDEQI